MYLSDLMVHDISAFVGLLASAGDTINASKDRIAGRSRVYKE
jgi:hypothetical protein